MSYDYYDYNMWLKLTLLFLDNTVAAGRQCNYGILTYDQRTSPLPRPLGRWLQPGERMEKRAPKLERIQPQMDEGS